MKKLNTVLAILVIIFAVNGLKAQTYPVPKFSFHIHGGYTLGLPDLKGDFPTDLKSRKDPPPYFINNGFNFGGDVKYYLDKKSTFGLILSLTYSMLSSGDKTVTTDSSIGIYGPGTFRANMNLFTIGFGAEYDFAPKRPANPFVNVQFTTNIIGGNMKFTASDGTTPFSGDMNSAVRFGALFAAGVDVKLSKNIGIVIGGRYAFANLFGKASDTSVSSTSYALDDKESTTHKSRKMAYLQFYAGMSFYFGQKTYIAPKK